MLGGMIVLMMIHLKLVRLKNKLIREISDELQNLTAIPEENRMSVNEWLAID